MRAVTAPRGVTLIELLVAVAILALGTLAAWRSFDAAGRGVGGQAARVLAQEAVLNRAAELYLDPAAPRPDVERLGGIDWTLTLTVQATEGGLAQTEIRAAAPGQPGAVLTVWLAP